MEPITFEYRYSEQDLAAFQSLSFQKLLKRSLPHLAVLFIANAVLLACWLAVSSYGFIAGLGAGAAFASIVTLAKFKGTIRAAWEGNPMYNEKCRAIAASDSLSIQGATFGTKRLWKSLRAYEETDDYFVLFQAKHPILWLPKRAFPEQVEQMRVLLHSNLPANS